MAMILRQDICLPRPGRCLKAIREISSSAGSDELVNTFGGCGKISLLKGSLVESICLKGILLLSLHWEDSYSY